MQQSKQNYVHTSAQNEVPNQMVRQHFLLYSRFFNFSLKLMFWFGGSLSASALCVGLSNPSKVFIAPIPSPAAVPDILFQIWIT